MPARHTKIVCARDEVVLLFGAMSSPTHISSIVDVIHRNAAQHPDKRIFTFLADGETESNTLTYHELDWRARSIAHRLEQYAAPGARAILLYPPGLELITAMLACLYAGIVLVPALPLPPNRSPETLIGLVQDTKATLLLTAREMGSTLRDVLPRDPAFAALRLIATDELLDGTSADAWQLPHIDANSLAVLLYTSGSTGAARGIAVRHGNIIETIKRMQHRTKAGVGGVTVTWKPPYHGSGIGDMLLTPLVGGMPIVILPTTTFLERPVRWLQAITRYQATTSGGPSFGYGLCVEKISAEECDSLDLSSWRVASVGNEVVNPRTLDAFTEKFAPWGFCRDAWFIKYGLSEATINVATTSRLHTCILARSDLLQNRVRFAAEQDADTVTLASCGQPTPGADLKIVDPATLTECAVDSIGEIWVAGAFAFQGYWNKPAETERTFHAYLADTGQGPFLRTGDMGLLHDGELYITGRLKDMLIMRGRNYYSEDIEKAAGTAHAALLPGAAAAFSIPENGEEQVVIVHEVRSRALHIDVEEIASAIRRTIAQELRLPVQQIVLVQENSLPRTPGGKIQRYLCRAQLLEGI